MESNILCLKRQCNLLSNRSTKGLKKFKKVFLKNHSAPVYKFPKEPRLEHLLKQVVGGFVSECKGRGVSEEVMDYFSNNLHQLFRKR